MSFGRNLKRARLNLDLTQEELAKKVGVSTATINKYESGVIENPSRKRIYDLAKALDCSPIDIMGWTEPDHASSMDAQLAQNMKSGQITPSFPNLIEGAASPEETFIIETFRKASVQQRFRIMQYIMHLTEGKTDEV